MDGPKILTIDIETSPFLAYEFEVKTHYIGPQKMVIPSRMLCFAAKWYHQNRVQFHAEWLGGHDEMVREARDLMDEADFVITYNGVNFDHKRIDQEIAETGQADPSPYKKIDLYRIVKQRFAWEYLSLAEVCKRLGVVGKLDSGGFETWRKVLDNDSSARSLMRRYNKQDVVATEALYERLLPYIPNHPNVNLYYDAIIDACPRCGQDGDAIIKKGFSYTRTGKYQQFTCRNCGAWFRGNKRIAAVGLAPC